jgi:hypothetical protein
MTGVPLKLKDTYLLDKSAVLKTICKLTNDIRQLEYLLEHLGKVDKVSGSRKNNVLHRLVSKPAAEAFATNFPDSHLFISWEDFKVNNIVRLIKSQRKESIYAKSLRQLTHDQILASARLGRVVLLHFEKGVRLPKSIRHAVLAGLCTVIPHWSAAQVIALVNSLRYKRHNPLPLLPESAKQAVVVINRVVATCTT